MSDLIPFTHFQGTRDLGFRVGINQCDKPAVQDTFSVLATLLIWKDRLSSGAGGPARMGLEGL
jgi:hypothetical protein